MIKQYIQADGSSLTKLDLVKALGEAGLIGIAKRRNWIEFSKLSNPCLRSLSKSGK